MLHICTISRTGSDSRGEWVSVCNDGMISDVLTGLEITDFTKAQQHAHVYKFPALSNGTPLVLAPGQVAYVFTGKGKNEWITTKAGKRAVLLFAGKSAPIWNNTGDVAYLRKVTTGQFVDTKTVGSPARHPRGH